MIYMPVALLPVIVGLSWLIGYGLAAVVGWLTEIIRDWMNDRRQAKTTVILLGKDGSVFALPKGATYTPIRMDNNK